MTQTSVVLLTQGDRDRALHQAVTSVRAQTGCEPEIVIVANGATLDPAPDVDRVVTLAENAGIPGGRNRGTEASSGEIIFFLDDDARFADDSICNRVLARFHSDPDLAVISFRIVDPITGRSERRHVPRLGNSDPARSSQVTTFLGGACAIRASAMKALGGYPAEFFYAHEETDLAWRLIDMGFRVEYQAELIVHHPQAAPSRHPDYHSLSMRNRVLLARRNLPIPLVYVYPIVWLAISTVRARSLETARRILSAFRAGWSMKVERSPISWQTVWRLTRLGRPPIV